MNNTKTNIFEKLYLILIFLFLYAPIAVLIVFSFNQSRIFGVWTGFSLKWYGELFKDRFIMNAVETTIVVAIATTIISTCLELR